MTLEQENLLVILTRADTQYQRIKQECAALEEDYRRILAGLEECDRLVLERYIALCEELDHRRICIAMELRIKNGD